MAAIDELLRQLGLAPTFDPRGGSTMPVQPGPRTGLPVMPNPGPPSGTMPLQPGPRAITDPIQQQPIVRTDPIPTNPRPVTPRPDNGTGDNPYFDAGSTGGKKNLYDTGWSKEIGKANPLSEWTRWTSLSGMGGNNRMGQFAKNQFGNFQNAFNAHLLERPDANMRDFAKQTDPMAALRNEWLGSSAQARGLNNASRASTIRWG